MESIAAVILVCSGSLHPCANHTSKCTSLGLDISADLVELGRTPIVLVSAGVKSILDVGRTLEFLVDDHILKIQHSIPNYSVQETHGVNVVTYGGTRDFPAFYVPRSGFQVCLTTVRSSLALC